MKRNALVRSLGKNNIFQGYSCREKRSRNGGNPAKYFFAKRAAPLGPQTIILTEAKDPGGPQANKNVRILQTRVHLAEKTSAK